MKMKMTSEQNTNGDVNTKMAHIPAQIHHHLDSVLHRSDGGIFLAASSLTGRYWSGSLWYFDKVENAPDVEKCAGGVELDTGVNDMTLLSDNQILLGTDTGDVQIWKLNDTEATITRAVDLQAHDNSITSISTGPDNKRAVSGSIDKSVKIWDLEEMTATRRFKAHYGAVTSVAYHPTQPDIFLSCGQDGRLLLWDTRKPKPASILDASALKSNPTTVAWQPNQECAFAVGSEGGAIGLFDHSKREVGPTVIQAHSRIVHRLAFSPKKAGWVASASDDCVVSLSDFNSNSSCVTWQSDLHKDFVRGISWNPTCDENLVTCGWDFQVHSHTVRPQPVSMDTKTCDEDMDTLSPSAS